MKLIVATHNEGKLVEIRDLLEEALGQRAGEIDLVSAGSLNLPDPVETGTSFEENALLKAREAALRTGAPAIADDSGLIVDVMGAAPGILSARWAGAHGHDRANVALLLAQIEDIPGDRRSGRFRCAAALAIPAAPGGPEERKAGQGATIGRTLVKIGEMPGRIIREPRGGGGFGYDPIFVPDEQPADGQVPGAADRQDAHLTAAEMTFQQKNAISHRAKALNALAPSILELL